MDKQIKSIKELIKVLEGLSCGQDFIDFSYKIIKTNNKILGVKIPVLRKIAKRIANQEHEWLYKSFDNSIYEIILIQGLVIACEPEEKAKNLFGEYIKQIDNWAVVDTVVGSIKFAKNKSKETFNFFKGLALGVNEFEVRFGIVGLMKFYIDAEFIFDVLAVISVVKCEKYYVEMAMSWLISEVLIKNPQTSLEIMQNIIKNMHLNKFIINKSIQKACESYRIDKKIKIKLKEMKIK